MAPDDVEDERQIELDTISSIFPEIVLDPKDPFSASLDIPVVPNDPVPVVFPESSDGGLALDPAITNVETQNLSNLPSLRLQITLPEGYPATTPPVFQISTHPSWLSQDIITRLEKEGLQMWEEFGHDQVLYAYIDHLETSSKEAFGVLEKTSFLEISQDHKISLLDYDINAKRAAFEKGTFDCGICLGLHSFLR
jgi:E3 ubiquitin-protein ligase RNF14